MSNRIKVRKTHKLKTIEDGQKDALLKRANIKKLLVHYSSHDLNNKPSND